MMKVIMAFLTCFIFLPAGYGQTQSPMGHSDLAINTRQLSYGALTSSNLPIIFINTSKRRIGNDKSIADAGIIWNDKNELNHVTDSFNNYYGKILIEKRGSSSRRFPKKSYNITTADSAGNEFKVQLLGLPKESDWILYAPYDDKSLMRDVLAYKIARDMGRYASRTVYAELILNGNYMGVYILEEKIKSDDHRIDIEKMNASDTSADALTGGYILKIDRPSGNGGLRNLKTGFRVIYKMVLAKVFGTKNKPAADYADYEKKKDFPYFESAYTPDEAVWQKIEFSYQSPPEKDLTPQQTRAIKKYIYAAETSLRSSNFSDPDSGYRKYFDVSSLIDFFICNEVTRNVDAYRLSTYMYKDRDSRGGKLTMGPVWDFNVSMGNANYCEGQNTNGWAYEFNSYCKNDAWLVPFWWKRLMEDSSFTAELGCRWNHLRGDILSTPHLMTFIDSLAMQLEQPQQRNFERWPILGSYIWPNYYVGSSYADEIKYLKQWLTSRLNWLDDNMPGKNERCLSVRHGMKK